jgi:hypothetical protein
VNTSRRRIAFAVLTAMLAATAASPASADMLAAPTTLASWPIASPRAAMTPNGNALVVWSVTPQDTWPDDQPATFHGSWRSPGGTFGPPFVVGSGRTVTDVVAAGNEGVVLAGRDSRGVIASFLRTGATRGHDQVLAPGDLGTPQTAWSSPLLTADGAGNVVAALERPDKTAVAFSRAPGALFGPEEFVADGVDRIATAMNTSGDVAIALSRRAEAHVSVRRAGEATFAPPEPTGITQSWGSLLDVVVTPNGDVAVSDRVVLPSSPTLSGPNVAFRPAGGTFPAKPEEIASLNHTLVAGAGSDVTIADVSTGNFGTPVPRLTDRRPDGSLTAPMQIGPGPVCDGVDAETVTNSGNLAIMFRTPCGYGPIGPRETPASLLLVERPARGVPTPPVRIGPPDAGYPAVASNGSGSVVIAWQTNVRKRRLSQVQAVVRDGPAELALLGLGKTLAVRDGRARLALGCVGLRDCGGSLTIKRVGASGARSRVTTGVRLARGTSTTKRVRLPRHALRGKRPRLKLTLTLLDGARVAGRRSQTVGAKRR